MQLVQRAVNEDKQRNYQEALSLYQHALVYFLESINCKYHSDDFYFRGLENSVIEIGKGAKISLIFNHLNRKPPKIL